MTTTDTPNVLNPQPNAQIRQSRGWHFWLTEIGRWNTSEQEARRRAIEMLANGEARPGMGWEADGFRDDRDTLEMMPSGDIRVTVTIHRWIDPGAVGL